MEAKIFVIAFPTMETVAEKISSLLEEAFDKPKVNKSEPKRVKETCDFTPKHMKVTKPRNGVQPWGVCGTPANENLRFGYQAPAIDEPRSQDYDCRWEFEDDHEAFDRLVSAAEDCVARGLARPEGVVEHKCGAIRKPIGCPPPMRYEIPSGELIGETDWWSTEPCMWGF